MIPSLLIVVMVSQMYIYIKTYQLFTLNICRLLYVNYTSMKLQGKAGHQLASTWITALTHRDLISRLTESLSSLVSKVLDTNHSAN